MVNTQLGAILKEFEPIFKCPLAPDSNNSCLIKMGIGISIQIELDRYGLLLIGCNVGTLQMGTYRDQIIKQALKSNDSTLPSSGVFGFSQKSNHLILFIKLNPAALTNAQLQALLPPLILKAKQWSEAISRSEVPSIKDEKRSGSPSGIFGLISKEQ